jgi:hypothetical protein
LLFIIQNDETDPIDTRFQGLPQGAQLDLVSTADGHAYSFRIHYDANAEAGQAAGGNDVALEAVPEPASAALLLAAALTAVLAGLRRIRKARSLV